jgi:hypothetical protein
MSSIFLGCAIFTNTRVDNICKQLFTDARVRNIVGTKKEENKFLAILDKTSNVVCLMQDV